MMGEDGKVRMWRYVLQVIGDWGWWCGGDDDKDGTVPVVLLLLY